VDLVEGFVDIWKSKYPLHFPVENDASVVRKYIDGKICNSPWGASANRGRAPPLFNVTPKLMRSFSLTLTRLFAEIIRLISLRFAGHTRQGLKCKLCRMNVHPDCQAQVPRCQPKGRLLLRRQRSASELDSGQRMLQQQQQHQQQHQYEEEDSELMGGNK